MKLYRSVAEELEKVIRSGRLRPGEKLPSIRRLRRSRNVSRSTVLHAYAVLESVGIIEARPRSGYFVAAIPRLPLGMSTPKSRSTRVAVSDLIFDILEASRDRGIIPLGSAFPGPTLFPWKKLARYLGSGARRLDPWSTVESLPPGNRDLRRQIARRYVRLGMAVDLDQIIITAGALEALDLSLRTVTRPGDTIAVESPSFYGCLQAAERLRLNVVELPTHPQLGVDIGALAKAISAHSIRACWFMTTLQHPTGATMPEVKKREMVRLLSAHDIVLIEDDAYAELQFDQRAALPAKAYDRKGMVLHCGSFSKCLAPGYRLGWVAAGRFKQELGRRKIESSLATSLPIQQGVALMLRYGSYDAHLRRLRQALRSQQASALAAIRRYFPRDTRVSHPDGGYFLWIECGAEVDSLEVHRLALDSGITIAPGPMFSARRQFRNFIRLNYGHPWTPAMDRAVAQLGDILHRRAVGAASSYAK